MAELFIFVFNFSLGQLNDYVRSSGVTKIKSISCFNRVLHGKKLTVKLLDLFFFSGKLQWRENEVTFFIWVWEMIWCPWLQTTRTPWMFLAPRADMWDRVLDNQFTSNPRMRLFGISRSSAVHFIAAEKYHRHSDRPNAKQIHEYFKGITNMQPCCTEPKGIWNHEAEKRSFEVSNA